ncbi:MAG: hypothetical protein HKM24_00540, partial [Gammaproteobacteria bacterium]|nr:hypothetical protein [Gammaproteobacteria bacterium]
PDNASWQAFVDGDILKSVNLIDESFYEPEKARREAAIERGVYAMRVRVVQFPITAYLRWEFETYFAMLRLGEEIRVIEQRDIEDIEEQGRLSDVWLFDSNFALVPKYSSDGELTGGWQIVEAAALREIFTLSDQLIDRSEPFQSFYARLKQESDTLTTW